MTDQELFQLEIECKAYLNVIHEFTKHNIDIRMSIAMDNFLNSIKEKANNIQIIIDNERNK